MDLKNQTQRFLTFLHVLHVLHFFSDYTVQTQSSRAQVYEFEQYFLLACARI